MAEIPTADVVIDAIRRSWSIETSAWPEEWSETNRAKGQCDVSSFVAWDYLGGDLVLSEVFIDGEFSEYHYWNRIDGQDLDISKGQFSGLETITEISVVEEAFLQDNQSDMKPEVAARIDLLRTAVQALIGTP